MNLAVLRTKLQRLGPHQVAGHYAYEGLNRVLPADLVRAFVLLPEAEAPQPLGRGDERCERLSPSRLLREAEDPASGLRRPDVDACLEAGEECFGVVVDGVLASHAWYTSRPAALRPGVSVRFDPRYIYSRWAFTRADYRGRGLHALGKRHALACYVAEGRRGILSTVKAANFESLRSARRQGGRGVGWLLAVRTGDRSWLWASAGCQTYGMALEDTSAPPPAPVTNAL
jgi:hypothetical protein